MKKTPINLLAGLGLLFMISARAHAGLQIQYSLDGGAKATLGSGASGSTVSYTDFLVQDGGGTTIFKLTGSSNSDSPGDPSIAYLLSSTTKIQNMTTSTHELQLYIGDVGFSSPTAPPFPALILNSHLGGSVTISNAANLLSFTSCVDSADGQNTCPSGTATAGPGTPDITGLVKGSFDDDKSATIFSLGTPYSMSQYLDLTLGGSSLVNFSNNTSLTGVPEPLSIALLGGIVVLTSGLIRRKSTRREPVV